MDQTKPAFFSNLDGFRALAAFLVIFAHISYWFKYPDTIFFDAYTFILSFGKAGGRLGVIFFFVLSGFLITYLMYLEQNKTGKLNVIYFYIRRMLRIWPLYYLTLIIGFVVYPLILGLTGQTHHENASIWLFSLFAANFDHIYFYFPSTNMLGVQWSVSVEEQFYLLWPVIFFFFNNKRIFPVILILFVLFSEFFHFRVASGLKAGDYHLFSCFKYLAFGALLAYSCFRHTDIVRKILSAISKPLNIVIYVLCISMMFLQETLITHFSPYQHLYHIIPVLFFGFVMLEQNFSERSFYKIGGSTTLAWLGKISYGLYLTHMIAINMVIGVFGNGAEYVLLKGMLVVILAILISHLSYNYFEKYFLSLKHRFSLISNQPGKIPEQT